MKKQLAVKLLDLETASDRDVRRFQREANAASSLDHPGLVKVYDFGVTPDANPYLVMDYCPGKTLAEIMRASGTLPLDGVIDLFIQICSALAYAHEHDVIHRDIKPSNIMVLDRGDLKTAKILDFGTAKIMNAEDAGGKPLTLPGQRLGTPLYMSPEQCLERPLDARSDIYSLGCVFFAVLTGQPPLVGETGLMTMMRRQNEEAALLNEASSVQRFPQQIEEIIAKMLRRNHEERYQKIADVAADLSGYQKSLQELERVPEIKVPQPKAVYAAPPYARFAVALTVVCVGAAVLIAGFFRYDRTPQLKRPIAEVTTEPTSAPAVHKDESELAETPFEYYSPAADLHASTRHYHFPKESLGLKIRMLNPACRVFAGEHGSVQPADEWIPMSGDVTVENFAPFALRVSADGAYPILLRWFRSDEIEDLEFARSSCSVDCLRVIDSYKVLRSLNVQGTKITDEDLRYVDALPSLDDLNVSDTEVTGTGLLRAKRRKELRVVKAERLKDASIFIDGLREFSGLEELNLVGCALGRADLSTIGICAPRLVRLNLGRNPAITDDDLKLLLPLQDLTELYVDGCNLSPASINTLRQFSKLKELEIDYTHWEAASVNALKQALPQCRINQRLEH
jgi:serine/threonine protein kinase